MKNSISRDFFGVKIFEFGCVSCTWSQLSTISLITEFLFSLIIQKRLKCNIYFFCKRKQNVILKNFKKFKKNFNVDLFVLSYFLSSFNLLKFFISFSSFTDNTILKINYPIWNFLKFTNFEHSRLSKIGFRLPLFLWLVCNWGKKGLNIENELLQLFFFLFIWRREKLE